MSINEVLSKVENHKQIKNDEIDLKHTNLNFDWVENQNNLYNCVKDRVDDYQEQR
ncbi:hypothetical protein K4U66_11240 [Staphylococcus epidermidis]|uniref:hypothetical protein n=1 Tax=Staphylococcus epidermidis TaxID=1282 RepID=UPI002DB821A7|nr:hypothetical protein [Staphylococcus epidermidis]MCG1364639.1 hypothetical protein [Staphylococcus epidermidis]MCG1696127.1 hypothetical protein [Staphylococcus epidermidis]MEB5704125.1 hypothetical protein [Staphylococcus epidermidis]MEB7392278.1 hypothetical protein [Staphylococcus epidermidis]